jgi:hypothetical protein
MAWDSELDDFKTRIDLREYAAAQGYTLDHREGWRSSGVLNRKTGRSSGRAGQIEFPRTKNGWVIDELASGTRLVIGRLFRRTFALRTCHRTLL